MMRPFAHPTGNRCPIIDGCRWLEPLISSRWRWLIDGRACWYRISKRCARLSARSRSSPVPYRRHLRFAGPSPCDMAIAARRRGFRIALAHDQERVLKTVGCRYATQREQDQAPRKGYLAKTVLGTSDSRRHRLAAACRLHSLQPGQARPCSPSMRLAIQQFPPVSRIGSLPGRLGRRKQVGRRFQRIAEFAIKGEGRRVNKHVVGFAIERLRTTPKRKWCANMIRLHTLR